MRKQKNATNHFEQQFQESQQQFSECSGDYNQPTYGTGNEEGYPIQLLKVRPSRVEISEQALDIISQCDAPVGFVCLVGKYRTGKSFLLNKLLFLQGQGFRVDPSTSACTQGLWMWSKPVFNDRLGNYLFFLDTQGLDSLEKGADNDTKVFTLATLISSYLVFNSVGAIDQRSIGQLNTVTALSRNIIADQNISNRDNEDNLFRFMPKFLWLLRDFTLELQDEHERRIGPTQYLQNCLTQQNSLVRVNEDARKVKRALMSYFKDRDCMVLVRPAREENDLYKLNSLPDHALRREFVEGVRLLRERIMKNAGPKMYDGEPLYGSSIASMIESYVKAINNNGIPNIKTAWEHISEDQGVFAYNRAIEKYFEVFENEFGDEQPKGEEIHESLMVLREQTMAQFNRNVSSPSEGYSNKLKEFLKGKEADIIKTNKQLNECRNLEIMRDESQKLMKNISEKRYAGNKGQLNEDINEVIRNYNHQARGENKGDIITELLTSLNPIILNLEDDKPDSKDNQADKEFYESQLDLLKRELKSTKQQLQTAKNVQKIEAAKTKQPNKLPPGKKQPEKKPGCCGTADCAIM